LKNPKTTKKLKAVLGALSKRKEGDSVPSGENDDEENLSCGVCSLKYLNEKPLLKGEWIRHQQQRA